jgi:hypothetical protein
MEEKKSKSPFPLEVDTGASFFLGAIFLGLILEGLNIEGENSDVEILEFPWSRYEAVGEKTRNGEDMEIDLSDPGSDPS